MKDYVEIRIYIPNEILMNLIMDNLALIEYEGFEEDGNFLIAYCEEDMYDEELLKTLLNFPDITFAKQIIPAQNWNALWESNFEPVVVEDFAAIRADFHEPIKDVQHEIIITPKMSFGTGHHATTYMMIQQMKRLEFRNKSVLDFGTGTGILAILAQKMGSTYVMAIDNDEWSITNAEENFEKNNCVILLRKDDYISVNKQFDIILANINRNIIEDNFSDMAETLSPDGYLLLSGLLEEDEKYILRQSIPLSLEHINTESEKGWISVLFKYGKK